jgi:replication factor C subunit 3/5
VVVLNEVDRLSTSAQAALRRTMEKYSAGCRLILSCNSACRVIEPVRSRCMPVRVPSPSEAEIEEVLQSVCQAERVKLPAEFAHQIAVASERNLRRALLMLEASKVQAGPAGMRADQTVARADWQTFITQMAAEIVARQSPEQLLACRSKFYELLTNCIPPEVILKQLSVELLAKTDQALVMRVCREAAFYEHRIRKGQKPIFHLEAFAAKYMTVHSQWTLSMTQGM